MNKSSIFFSIIFLFAIAISAIAQPEISPERKQAIDSLALEKVKDLGKYISIIGNKDTPFSEANRVIDRAMELFADDSQMGVFFYKSKGNPILWDSGIFPALNGS